MGGSVNCLGFHGREVKKKKKRKRSIVEIQRVTNVSPWDGMGRDILVTSQMTTHMIGRWTRSICTMESIGYIFLCYQQWNSEAKVPSEAFHFPSNTLHSA